jgi:hypothetical protein
MGGELLSALGRCGVLLALLALGGLVVLAPWPRPAAGDGRAGDRTSAPGSWLLMPLVGLGGLVSALTLLGLGLPLRGALLVSGLVGAGVLGGRLWQAWRARPGAPGSGRAAATGAPSQPPPEPHPEPPGPAGGPAPGTSESDGGEHQRHQQSHQNQPAAHEDRSRAAMQVLGALRRPLARLWQVDPAVLAVGGSSLVAVLVAAALPALSAGQAAGLVPLDGEVVLPVAQWLWREALAAGPPPYAHPLLRAGAALVAEGTPAWSFTLLHALATWLAGGDVVAGYWLAQAGLLALVAPAVFLVARDVLGLPRGVAVVAATLAWANPLTLWLFGTGAPGHLTLLVLLPATLAAGARALAVPGARALLGAGMLGAALVLAWPPATPEALVLAGAALGPAALAQARGARGPALRRLLVLLGLSLLPAGALGVVLLRVRPALAAYARDATWLVERAPAAEPHTAEAAAVLPALSDLVGPGGMALLALLAALVVAGLVAALWRGGRGRALAAGCLLAGALVLALGEATNEPAVVRELAPLAGLALAAALAARWASSPARPFAGLPPDHPDAGPAHAAAPAGALPGAGQRAWRRGGLLAGMLVGTGGLVGLAVLAGLGLVEAGRAGTLGSVLPPELRDLAALRAAVPAGSRVWLSPQALDQPELAGQARRVAGALALALPQQHFVGQVRTQLVAQGQPLDTDAYDVAILGAAETAEAAGLTAQDQRWAQGVLRAYARRPRWVALPARELVWLGRLNLLHQLVLDLDSTALRVRAPAGTVTLTPALPVRQVELALLSPQTQEVTLRVNGAPDRRTIGPGLVLWHSGALTPAGPDGRLARQEVIVEPAAPLYVLALRLSNTYRGAGTEVLGEQALLVGGRCRAVPEGLEVELDYLNLQLDVDAAWALQLEATPLGAKERVGWWDVPVVVRQGAQVVSLTLQPEERQSRLLINGLPFEGRSTWQEGPVGRYQLTLTLSKNARPERTLPLCRYTHSGAQVRLEPDPGALLVLRPGQRDEAAGRGAPRS